MTSPKIASFLNDFEKSAKFKLAVVNEKMTKVSGGSTLFSLYTVDARSQSFAASPAVLLLFFQPGASKRCLVLLLLLLPRHSFPVKPRQLTAHPVPFALCAAGGNQLERTIEFCESAVRASLQPAAGGADGA